MDDIQAVLAAVGSTRAALVGIGDGVAMTLLFAVTYPEQTAAVVLYGCGVSATFSEELPYEPKREDALRDLDAASPINWRRWTGQVLAETAPGLAQDDETRRWWDAWIRHSTSPGAWLRYTRTYLDTDVRGLLDSVHVPTLVLHRVGDRIWNVGHGRYLAKHIPAAEYLELPGADHAYFVEPEPIVDAIGRFLAGIWESGEWEVVDSGRVVATILFTDIVGSTARAAELGDSRWRELLERHHARIRQQLSRFRGNEIETAGDGFLASFDGPARAISCACAIREAVDDLGLVIRAGLHTGECELLDGKVAGIAVSIGARVAAQAQPGEVLVSQTVKDLVAGSGLEFEDRGAAELKGVPGEWGLYAVAVS